MSKNYLKSSFGMHELKVALSHVATEKRSRLIIILYEDIGSFDKLAPEVRDFMTVNTYIDWKDKWFWDKLIYSMPHKKIAKNKNSE